jgi:hypothetical protein
MNPNTISIIDSHVHCGIQDRSVDQSFESYCRHIKQSPISGAAIFPPVYEIYDRYDIHFTDNPEWQKRRKRANDYLLNLEKKDFLIIPYFFIWNDFAVSDISPKHRGIKWHRHADEPIYHYDTPQCRRAVDEIIKRNMPVVLEEELANTIRFIRDIAVGAKIIIPHLGGLNGGYRAIKREKIWELDNVYTDTALAPSYEIMDYIETYGHHRILFGSDFPFGAPQMELSKIEKLPISDESKTAILGLNLNRLLADSNRQTRI